MCLDIVGRIGWMQAFAMVYRDAMVLALLSVVGTAVLMALPACHSETVH